ncbi:tetratricopeptide repeat protein [uncultured Roseivirga sp.]|uniref:tetratricopeptide repeat protein n=1 Tax=uncultured Roseivirga sp. TaxID=543088 RepID=UPI0030DB8AFE|tara:strand:+ start:385015 stop:386838 length:1824 start_codon:yes stop_codon:yes gene_type:complete
MRKTAILLFMMLISSVGFSQVDAIALANEYYEQGDFEKALKEYKKLAKVNSNISRIHDNYLKLLLGEEEFSEAEKYLKSIIKDNPDNFFYSVDLGMLYKSQKEEDKAENVFDDLISDQAKQAGENNKTNGIRFLAQIFFEKNLRQKGLDTYQAGRKAMNRPDMFSLELANAYQLMNQKHEMILEYLVFSKSQPQNISYVKNSFQRALTEPEDLDTLETTLYEFIQTDAGNSIYNDLLVWTHLQQKNFAAALRQARALDRRLQNNAENIINVGLIAFRNQEYKTAQKAFDYVLNEFPDSPSKNLAARYVLLADEEVVKETYPVDTTSIKNLIVKYEDYKSNLRDVFNIIDANRRVAHLYAFYLNQIPKAIEILTENINQPVGKHRVIAESKMDLADIYLLNEEPWESILLYAQVERMFKDEPLGYEAKLKSAKLSYFKGEFELAQSHLDILKLATSREIANDALNLSILIKNNTVFDSTDVVMQEYANIELQLFQNQKNEAIVALNQMIEKYPNHSIIDEVYFLMAKTERELGHFDKALAALAVINQKHYFEILGDDALFLTGIILEDDLKDNEKAMETYLQLLEKFKGSIFVSEARKRLRELRGDFG